MKCPECKKTMTLVSEDFSYDFRVKPKKKYFRSRYWCKDDDVWITEEILLKQKKPSG